MFKTIFIIIFFSILFGNDTLSDDLAYVMVMEKINKKTVPVDYINKVFLSKKIERHKKIPERFARPYEKKSWPEYKKLFIKDSRIVAGTKFYSENKDLITNRYLNDSDFPLNADAIILRHVLDDVPNPISFLNHILKINSKFTD